MKIIARYKKGDTTLRITENRLGLRGSILENGRRVSSAMFYERDRENTTYRVREYFGFLGSDVQEITNK